MSTIKDADYRAWKKTILGSDYLIWHDGLYTNAAEALTDEDRENGVRMLLYGISVGDSDAASTLAAMGEYSSLPAIRAALSTATGENKVQFACAIHSLSPEDSDAMAKELIEVLENVDGHYSSQLTAAMELREFQDKVSEQALLKAMEDKEYLVRYHAHNSLLARWGWLSNRTSSTSFVIQMRLGVMNLLVAVKLLRVW